MFSAKKNMYAEMQNEADVQCSKVELIVLIYDKIIKHLKSASKAINDNKLEEKLVNIDKALKIIELGLLQYLDMSAGDVAKNLKEFYLCSMNVLIKANLENNPQDLEKIADNFNNLKAAWEKIA
jgi:flagellar biosynthetic protein FliS